MKHAYLITYFDFRGRHYHSVEVEYPTDQIQHVVAKIRGLRDNGGPNSLPDLSGEWRDEGPIMVSSLPLGKSHPVLILPK